MNTDHKAHRKNSKKGSAASLFFLIPLLLMLLFSCGGKDEGSGEPAQGERSWESEGLLEGSETGISNWAERLSELSIPYFTEASWDLTAGGFGEDQPLSSIQEEGPFQLASFGPEGNLPSEVKEPVIWVLFTHPVIPLSRIGEQREASSVFTIQPSIAGSFRWYSTRMLVFQASGEVLPQREYRVTISEALQSIGGQTLSGKNIFTFRSEELEMRSAEPGAGSYDHQWRRGGVPLEEAAKILLRFNYPVDIETVASYLQLEAEGYNYRFSLSRPDNSDGRYNNRELESLVLMEAAETLPENSMVKVQLLPGARSRPDYIGKSDRQELSFNTITPFRFLRHSTWSYSFPGEAGATNPLFLEFSHPVDEESLLESISFEPSLPVRRENISVYGTTVRLSGVPYQFESEYLLTLGRNIRDRYGRSLGDRKLVKVTIPEAASFANFPNTGTRMLEAEFPPKIVFDYQNIEDGVWKAGAIEDPYSFWPENSLEPYPFPPVEKNSHRLEAVDLSPWLDSNGKGWIGFSWNFTPVEERSGNRPRWAQRNLTLQVTDLGLTVRYGYNRVVAWVTSLSTGAPVSGARVTLAAERSRIYEATSDSSGLASFILQEGEFSRYFVDQRNPWQDSLRIQVEHQGDRIEFKPNNSHNLWRSSPLAVSSPAEVQNPKGEIFLFTDRGLYRPGETVTFRGIDRNLHLGNYSSWQGNYSIAVSEDTWRGQQIHESLGQTTPSGGFFGEIPLSPNLRPGYYAITYSRPGGNGKVTFQVAEFERLTFQVGLSIPERLYYSGDTISAELKASYLAGGSLNNVPYTWSWTKEPAWYAPPGKEWEDFRFGPASYDRRYFLSEGEGLLGPDGSTLVQQQTSSEGLPGQAQRYRGEARVVDAGGAQVAARSSVVVHPASFYIGASLQREGWSWFVQKGEKVKFRWILVRPDGRPYRGDSEKMGAELFRREWKLVQQQGVSGRVNSRYEMVLEPVDELVLDSSSSGRGEISFTPPSSGSYLVRFRGEDDFGRPAVTELSFYATGSDLVRWGSDSPGMIGLETDRPSYAPGDTANILIKSPLPSGSYLVTVEREGIFDERVIELDGSANVIGIPVTEEHLPVVYVAVSSYSVRTREPDHSYFEPDLDKPKGYFGVVPVLVDTDSRSFDIEIVADKGSYRPGEEAEITLKASSKGRPVEGAEITFLAVDRGIVDLIGYHVPDPLKFFYDPRKFPIATAGGDSRSLLIDPVTYEVKDLHGGGGEDDKLDRREDFRPLAVFEPYALTDAQGMAKVRFTLPDTLTTYRATAIGVKENTFGRKEHELIAQNPLNVLSVVPELLRHRDTMEGGVTVTNLAAEPVEVHIQAASDLLQLEGESEKSLTLAGGSTELVRFLFSAPQQGEGSIRFTIRSEPLNEQLVRRIRVEEPAVFESVAAGGSIDLRQGGSRVASEFLRLPGPELDPDGSLQISLSASKLPLFEEAVAYLLNYPYDCYEQRASRLIPYIIFGETGAFPAFEELAFPRDFIARELRNFGEGQNSNGGLPYWKGSSWSSYYVTARVAQAAALAKAAGYPVAEELDFSAMLAYLRKPEEGVRNNPYLYALGLYGRALLGDDVSSEVTRYLQQGDAAGIAGYSLAGLAAAHSSDQRGAATALGRVTAFLRPSARTVDISETWESGASWYGSEVERLALVLMLFQRVEPDNPLRGLILESLIQRRRSARWSNTVENSWALVAAAGEVGLDGAPDLTATVALSGEQLLEQRFNRIGQAPVSRIYSFKEAPLSGLPRAAALPLSIDASGTGTLSYRLAMRYTIPSETAPALDMGLGVLLEMYDLEGRKVTGSNLLEGETYRVIVHLTSPLKRDFLALRVPVPSGTVILDKSFVTTAHYEGYDGPEELSGEDRSIARPNRTDILLNEARFFYDRFPQGRGKAEFMIRAVRPGVYPLPPAQAECMYEPEVFGRNEGKLLFIERRQ
jgi:alpha-2-macroglobulin